VDFSRSIPQTGGGQKSCPFFACAVEFVCPMQAAAHHLAADYRRLSVSLSWTGRFNSFSIALNRSNHLTWAVATRQLGRLSRSGDNRWPDSLKAHSPRCALLIGSVSGQLGRRRRGADSARCRGVQALLSKVEFCRRPARSARFDQSQSRVYPVPRLRRPPAQ
jgi:hypothetical protein